MGWGSTGGYCALLVYVPRRMQGYYGEKRPEPLLGKIQLLRYDVFKIACT